MNDDQLNRYSRQIMLPEFDYQGQQTLLESKVLIIGLGGLGSPVALYLAAAGVGHLVLVDDDEVDISNLQRQIAHQQASVGLAKVVSAAASVQGINGDVTVTCIQERLSLPTFAEQAAQADLVVDCTDSHASRWLINQSCYQTQTPLVFGAAIRMEGQLSVFDSRQNDSPCYACLYPALDEKDMTCAANGIMAPVVGAIGCLQAMEAIKVLTKIGAPAIGKLLLYDAMSCQWHSFGLPKLTGCQVCGGKE